MTEPRPLTIGEIFDRAVTLVARNWRVVLLLSLVTAVPDTLMRALNRGHLPRGPGGTLVEMLAEVIVYSLTGAALVMLFADAAAPREAVALLRRAAARYARAFWTMFVLEIGTMVVILLFAFVIGAGLGIGSALAGLPGAISGSLIGAIPAVIFAPTLMVALIMAFPVAILEDAGPVRAFAIATRRARGGGWVRAVLLTGATMLVVILPFMAFEWTLGRLAAATGAWWLLTAEPALIAVLGTGYGSALTTVVAIDYRNRREGADLAAALEAARSA
ncbi:MAG TPA: hypothetical protein VGC96_09775 [Candidatus Elarobacter sp.]|jgi:hypothetical protein